MNRINCVKVLLSFCLSCTSIEKKEEVTNLETVSSTSLEDWQPGYLDIHHINTGNGDTGFFVLPDGTTILFDAGIIDKERFEKKYSPLKASSSKPNNLLSPAQWTAKYIKNVMAKDSIEIDYAFVSHFHEDHYGSLVELGKIIPINKIIDRNYPNYDFPLDLKIFLKENKTFQEYISFIDSTKIPAEALRVGSATQIRLLNKPNKYPTFKIKNIKSNGTIWTGKGEDTFEYFKAEDMTSFYKGNYNENPLSLALKISYGDFDYFTGGDNTGLQGFGLPYWFDVETPMAKAVGEVEVTTLNHHGNRDATNAFFIKTLNPKVVVQQSWCSDHPGQEVYQRLIYKDKNVHGRDVFATNMHAETKVTYGPWFIDNYKSIQGHIVVRITPNGTYNVFILDETTMHIKGEFGPYQSK